MLEAGFIILTVILAIMLFAGVSYAANRAYTERRKRKMVKARVVILLVVWLSYVTVTSLNKFYLDPSLPPRIPYFLVFPGLLFIIYFFASRRSRPLIAAIPLSWVIYFQTFRIAVELLLFGLFMKHMLPWSATFEGYNFDIGIGITAPFIGYLAGRKRLYRGTIRAWNFTGIITLVIVVVILNTYAYRPWLFNQSGTILGKGFGTFPFTFLASFFLICGLFMHILALVKTGRSNYSN